MNFPPGLTREQQTMILQTDLLGKITMLAYVQTGLLLFIAAALWFR